MAFERALTSIAHTPSVTTGSLGAGRETLRCEWTFVGLAGTDGVADDADEFVLLVLLSPPSLLLLLVVAPLPAAAVPLGRAGEREQDIVSRGDEESTSTEKRKIKESEGG